MTVATNGVLNLSGTSTISFYGILTNAGTVNWTGTGGLQLYNYAPYGDTGGIVNLAGGVFNAENDQRISNWQGPEYFSNAGLFRKSPTTGTTTIGVIFTNTGTLEVDSGVVSLTSAYDNQNGTLSFVLTNASTYGSVSFQQHSDRKQHVDRNDQRWISASAR